MEWTAGTARGAHAEGTALARLARGPACSVFGELLALRALASEGAQPPALSLGHAEAVTRALRGALLRFAFDPPPAVLSGHEPAGRRLVRPLVALPALRAGGLREERTSRFAPRFEAEQS